MRRNRAPGLLLAVVGWAATLSAICAAPSIAISPVAYWTMDEISDGTLPDAAGGRHPAGIPELTGKKDCLTGEELPAFIPRTVPGIIGNALALESAGQGYLTVANAGDLTVRDGLTLMAWIKPANPACMRNMEILSCREDLPRADAGWRLRYACRSLVFEAVGASGEQAQVCIGQDWVPDGYWTHVAAVVEPEAIRLYVNGVERAAARFSGPLAPPHLPLIIGNHATIARWRHNQCPAFGGLLDDVQLFAQPLAEAAIFQEAVRRLPPPAAGEETR